MINLHVRYLIDSYIVYSDILCRSYSLVSVCVCVCDTHTIIIYMEGFYMDIHVFLGIVAVAAGCGSVQQVCWMKSIWVLGLLGGKK